MDLLGNLANLKVDTVLSAVDKYVPGAKQNIKNLADKAKAYVNNVSELELKVLEATNHDPWGPHGSVMQEITNNAFHSEGFYQIMGILDQRLQETAENWRLVYKSLLLLEYMAKHGPLSVADALVSYSRLSHLEKLRDRFEFKEASGRDQGMNVRQRAGALVALVQDRDRLAEERDKAAKNKSKYTGVSSGSMRYGGFGPGSTNSSSSFSTSRDYDSYGSSSMGHSSSNAFGGGSSSSSTFAGGSGTGCRRSSGSGGGDSTAAAADPVEATRQRIARLKADGALPSAAGNVDGDGAVGPGLESPDGLSPKKPKKLSEIKINPAISATFAKGGLAPPPSSSSGSKRAGAAAAPAATGIDLLGDLDVPAPAAAAPSSSTAKGGLDDWDGFASAAVAPLSAAAGVTSSAAATGDDDWAAFDSAPPASSSSQPKAAIDINSLLGPLPTTTPAAAAAGSAAGGASKAPLPLDDFCSLPAGPAAAAAIAPPSAAAAAPGFDPFSSAGPAWGGNSSSSSMPAAAAAGSADPFAASSAVHMAPQASKQTAGGAAAGPKLGPETAKAKDPFADLALI